MVVWVDARRAGTPVVARPDDALTADAPAVTFTASGIGACAYVEPPIYGIEHLLNVAPGATDLPP